jgi:hypothetical protein
MASPTATRLCSDSFLSSPMPHSESTNSSSPRLDQALFAPPSSTLSPGASHWHTPTLPLPQLVRDYQQALSAEQQTSAAIEDLQREIADLEQQQASLRASDPHSMRSPAPSLEQSQQQVLPLTPHRLTFPNPQHGSSLIRAARSVSRASPAPAVPSR